MIEDHISGAKTGAENFVYFSQTMYLIFRLSNYLSKQIYAGADTGFNLKGA